MKGSTQELIGPETTGIYSVDSSDSASRSGQKGKTIVSFVVDEDNIKKSGKNRKERWHRTETSYSPTQLVSILYCLVVSLIGLAAPVTEALREEWMSNHVVAAFTVFMFVGSILFLIYLLVMLSLNKRKKHKSSHDAAELEPTLSKTPVDGMAAAGDVVLLKRNQTFGSMAEATNPSGGEKGSTIAVNNVEPLPSKPTLPPQPSSPTSPNTPTGVPPSGVPPSPSHGQLSRQGDVFIVRRQVTMDDSRYEDGTSVLDLNPESVDDVAEYLQLSAAAGKTHEGTSLYLRLGCLVFAIANMVYVGLEIEHYKGTNNSCDVRDIQVYPIYFHLIFLVVQSFFLFKVSAFHVSKHKGLVSFGLMHVVATNMCVWLRFLVQEVMEGIHHAAHHDDGYELEYGNDTDDSCLSEESLLLQASPYLFPFILEYSLIAVATMLGMFAALHVRISRDTFQSVKRFLRNSVGGSSGSGSITAIHEDESGGISFSKAHTGTFLGFVTLAGSLVSIVLFFFYIEQQEDHESAALVYHITDTVLHVFMLIAVTIGIVRIFRMRYTLERINMIDNVLLIISMAGLFLFELFIMFSAFWRIVNEDHSNEHLTALDAAAAMMSVIQAFLQTGFIFTGQQRYPSTDKERTQKPGRGAITFLIISNVSMWLFKMFQVKEVAVSAHQNFYGNVAWPIIMNVNLPLMLFYRFHSSVCLAEMWFSVYEDIEENMLESSVVT